MKDDQIIERCLDIEYALPFHSRKRALKLALLSEFGVCFWCGVSVKDYGTLPRGTKEPGDMATLDHLVSRFFRKKGRTVIKVLSCASCNQWRGRQESIKYTREHAKKISTPLP